MAHRDQECDERPDGSEHEHDCGKKTKAKKNCRKRKKVKKMMTNKVRQEPEDAFAEAEDFLTRVRKQRAEVEMLVASSNRVLQMPREKRAPVAPRAS